MSTATITSFIINVNIVIIITIIVIKGNHDINIIVIITSGFTIVLSLLHQEPPRYVSLLLPYYH